jgi:hypothetical protein
MSDKHLHWLARESLRRLNAALPTASPIQRFVWDLDCRLHIEAASFGATRREINLTNNALFFVRHKGQTIERAFDSALESIRKPLA